MRRKGIDPGLGTRDSGLFLRLEVEQLYADYASCLGNNGPCGAVYNQLPPSMQMLALALGTCLLNKSCPTCNSSN